MATLEELVTPLTEDEIKSSIYSVIEAYGVRTSGWKPGAVARTIIAGVSIIAAAFSRLQASIAKSGFLALAEGEWLEILALQVYGVEKNKGTFAEGACSITNTAGGVFSFDIGDVSAKNSATGKTYRNVEAFTLAALEENVIVSFRAEEIGSPSTSESGAIDSFETTLLNVTITNPTALVGQDEESDPALRARCRDETGTLSPNGPKDAYRSAARNAKTSDGVPCGVTRVSTSANGSGGVTVYVATASGALSGTSGDLSTPFGAVEDAIHKQCEPIGINATVTNATPLAIDISYTAYIEGSTQVPSEVEAAIATKLAAVLSLVPIGGQKKTAGLGDVYGDFIDAAISAQIGIDIFVDLDRTLPAGDTAVAENEAPILGTLSGSVVVTTS